MVKPKYKHKYTFNDKIYIQEVKFYDGYNLVLQFEWQKNAIANN